MTHIKGNKESFYPNRPTAYKINSFNVDPTTQVALASPGLDLTLAQTQEFDFFNVDQTAADSDIISLPSGMDIGEQVVIYTLDIVVLATAGAETINGSATQDLVTATLYRIIKNTATTFVMASDSTGAALTAPSTTLTNAGTSDDYLIQALASSSAGITADEAAITFVNENTPDFSFGSLTLTNGCGFATLDEGQALIEQVITTKARLADLVANTVFGFVSANAGASVVDVALNNQLRIAEIEARLVAAEIIL